MNRRKLRWVSAFPRRIRGLVTAWAAVTLALLAIGWPGLARADEDVDEGPARDTVMIVQPAAATPAPLPSDFDRIDAGWIVFEFPSSVRSRVEALARESEAFRVRVSDDLGERVLDHALVRVARNPDQMAELAPASSPPPAYASGVAYPSLDLVLLSLQSPDSWDTPDLAEVLRHELVHLALYSAVAAHHVPRWFDEGFAIHESGELWFARWRTLAEASMSRRLMALDDLDRGFPTDGQQVSLAYAESADFVRFLMRGGDRARFGSLVQRVRHGVAFDRALEDAYGTSHRTLEYQWREEVANHFGLVPALTGGGLIWVLIMGLSAAAWLRRRRAAQKKLAQWAREEEEAAAALQAARASVAGAEPVGPRPAGAAEPLPTPIPAVPIVEHEGRWYTLH